MIKGSVKRCFSFSQRSVDELKALSEYHGLKYSAMLEQLIFKEYRRIHQGKQVEKNDS